MESKSKLFGNSDIPDTRRGTDSAGDAIRGRNDRSGDRIRADRRDDRRGGIDMMNVIEKAIIGLLYFALGFGMVVTTAMMY